MQKKIWRYGDNINTDMMFPGKYTYTCSTIDEIKAHLLEDIDNDFAAKVSQGDIVIAGRNFGCGSSRDQPVVGLKAVGIQAIIAESFARIFYRTAINHGLLLIECANAVKAYQPCDDVLINEEVGYVKIKTECFTYKKLGTGICKIAEAGGLLAYTREKLIIDGKKGYRK